MINIVVNHDGKKSTLSVNYGDNLLNILRNNNIFVDSPCSGKGTCGKCKVQFLKGAAVPNSNDLNHLTGIEIEQGFRLACSYKIENDFEIIIDSKDKNMDVMTEGNSREIDIDPEVHKIYMELKVPELTDQRDDVRRIEDAVGYDMHISPELMRNVPYILRDNNYKVTAAKFNDVLLDLEGGNTSKDLYGVAVDIGTTTIACYLLNLKDGNLIDVESQVNRQRAYGADVISRINYTMENESGTQILRNAIVNQLNSMIQELCSNNNIKKQNIYNVSVAGNTTMIHLFLGLPSSNISMAPYIPVFTDAYQVRAKEVGIELNGFVDILPGVASYVGSDITAGILSCGMTDRQGYSILLDLGTNGEIALGNKNGVVTCSTAAGPAFEGANIKCGIGGIKGAISKVCFSRQKIYNTIGDIKPCGICGSGVLDMVSELLRHGFIDETGRMVDEDEIDGSNPLKSHLKLNGTMKEFQVADEITFTQKDVREVQLAKASVSAGIKILLNSKGLTSSDVENIFIAGGFGNYMNIESALNIGLLPNEMSERVKSIGNSAGTGAKMSLLSRKSREKLKDIVEKTTYIELSNRADFQDYFVDSMIFGG